MDKETLFESLVVWLDTFKLDVAHSKAEQLSDGIVMSRVLHQIAPDFFNEGWLGKIKTEDVTNWRLKVSNLKKILKGILEYNLEVLGIQIHDFQMPDVNAIGEHSDHGELGRLLQLILGCAVNCTEKQEYIQRIMAMEESVQHAVMTAIQELMTKEITTDMDSEVGEQLKRTVEELNSAIEAKEELMQRCHELDLQVTALVEEKQNLILENEKLSDRLNQAENLDDPSTPAGKRFQLIQHQLDQCQEENYKLESAKDDFRIKVDVLQKEINELKDKNSELSSQADECRVLKDEVDDLRQAAEQAVKYEAQIESFKKRIEELSDLRGQVKLLEDKNTKYMQENLELQEEIRKSGAIKQQLEVYKRQNHELQSKLTEETKRADKAEFENKRMNEKLLTLQREKERIVTERDSLQEVNEELKFTQSRHVGSAGGEDFSATSSMELLSLPPEVKEKLLRLEHENKMLKLKNSGDSDEQSQLLQTMLDDANSRKNELETEIRLANQKVMELEAQIEDLQEMAKSTVSSSELVDHRKKIDELVQVIHQRDTAIQKERDSVVDIQNQLTSRNEEVEKLREKLEKKEEEKRVMEERYKKYFDKARAVINSQDAKLKSSGNNYPDVLALKQQILEKDKIIEQLHKDQERSKNTFEQEEKMIVSAWYNLGIQLNRHAAIERLENSQTQGQAFLSRQRQAHLRGQQRIPNSHTNPSSDLDLSSNACDLSEPANQNEPFIQEANLNTPFIQATSQSNLFLQSANQSSSNDDGCFASLFDCLLYKLRAELLSKEDITLQSLESMRASDIHSQLLAGLLGQNLGDISQVNDGDELKEDFTEVPDTPEFKRKSYRKMKLNRSLVPLLSQSTSSYNSSFKNSNTDLYSDNDDVSRVCAEQLKTTSESNSSYTYTMDFSKMCTGQSNSTKDLQNNSRFVNKLDNVDSDEVEVFMERGEHVMQPLRVTEKDEHVDKTNTENTDTDNEQVTPTRSLNSSYTGVISRSFLQLLESFPDENVTHAALDKQSFGSLSDWDISQNRELSSDNTASAESMTGEVARAIPRHLTGGLKSGSPRWTGKSVTPLRSRNENLPIHLQSPFINKIPSDRVTKRRTRKRKKQKTDVDKENGNFEFMNDSLSGTSQDFNSDDNSQFDML